MEESIPYTHAHFKHLSEEAKSSLKGLQICFTPIHIQVLKDAPQDVVVSINYFAMSELDLIEKIIVWFLQIGKTEDRRLRFRSFFCT